MGYFANGTEAEVWAEANCLGCEQTDNEFAQADGFDGFTEMADWFRAVHGLPFEGVVIYWDQSSTVDARGRADGGGCNAITSQSYQVVMAPAVGIEPTTN